jgi:predicted ribosomally synthesized peptide with SipW-like signal peptide
MTWLYWLRFLVVLVLLTTAITFAWWSASEDV